MLVPFVWRIRGFKYIFLICLYSARFIKIKPKYIDSSVPNVKKN